MYCSNCGNEISDKAVVCPQCGCVANKTIYDAAFEVAKNQKNNINSVSSQSNTEPKPDVPNPALSLLSFLLPFFGIVVYFADRKKTPVSCKRYLQWSIVSIVAWIVFYVLYILFLVLIYQ